MVQGGWWCVVQGEAGGQAMCSVARRMPSVRDALRQDTTQRYAPTGPTHRAEAPLRSPTTQPAAPLLPSQWSVWPYE